MSKLLLLGNIFLFALSIILLPKTVDKYQLSKTENFVSVTVTRLPNCENGYKNKFLDISYEGKIYSIRTKCKYVRTLVKGQQVSMLHKPDTDIFMFEQEDVTFDFVSLFFLAAVPIVCLIVGVKSLKAKGRLRTTTAYAKAGLKEVK